MRTTFSEMNLFNDTFQTMSQLFIFNGKVWGKGETQRVRNRKGKMWHVDEKGLRVGNKLDRTRYLRWSRDGIYQDEH